MQQMMAIFDVDGPQPVTVLQADRIQAELLAARDPDGRKLPSGVNLRPAEPGVIAPTVAYHLTETEARFTLNGSSGRVEELLSRLINAAYGPGKKIVLSTGDVLTVRSCASIPQRVPTKASGGQIDTGVDGLNQMFDLTLKLMSLAIQSAQ
ncbi:hypothetical protein HZU40_25035 [Mycolicibacterium fluoranthenivorans]|uniref:Uncharacterized protein n=1 Tax=Mycolicibacterium fluoranthenivorans TaxID=258505 RepID=A0A7G8PAS1_9MYCO|nr:hypothetical protein [Mycolicibacterium fluoranthenivorans]QNJ91437.1 hypothetical protein HZU40_25035 [Mycolicibacterium fluoranthenivorans]